MRSFRSRPLSRLFPALTLVLTLVTVLSGSVRGAVVPGGELDPQRPILYPLELPPYSGWVRYLSTARWGTEIERTGGGLVFINDDSRDVAIDAATGAVTADGDWPVLDLPGLRIHDMVVTAQGGTPYATRTRAHAQGAWEKPMFGTPLAFNEAGLWSAVEKIAVNSPETDDDVQLLDRHTGKILQHYALEGLNMDHRSFGDWALNPDPALDWIAVASNKGLALLDRKGVRVLAPMRRQWARLATSAQAIVALEYDEVPSTMDEPTEYSDGICDSVLSCFNVPGGSLRWRIELPDCVYPRALEPIVLGERYVALSRGPGVDVYSLADGRRVYATPAPPAPTGTGGRSRPDTEAAAVLSGDMLFLRGMDADGVQTVQAADLRSGQLTTLARGQVLDGPAVEAGTLLFMQADGRWPATPDSPVVTLWGLRLGPDGLPAPGQVALLNPPAGPDLRARLLASPAPLSDPELMAALYASGRQEYLAATWQIPASFAEQWDALALAQVHDYDSASLAWGHPSFLFPSSLERQLTPEFAPLLERWLADPALACCTATCWACWAAAAMRPPWSVPTGASRSRSIPPVRRRTHPSWPCPATRISRKTLSSVY